MINITKRVLIQALDCGDKSVVIADARTPKLCVVYVNPAVEKLTGYDASELIGRPLADLVLDGALPSGADAADQSTSPGATTVKQAWRTRKPGGSINAEFRLSPLYARPGRPAYWLLSETWNEAEEAVDSSDEQALRAALRDARLSLQKLQNLDPATGLPNHRAFGEMVRRDWAIARREQRKVSLLLFRVDALEKYRELFGRHAADSCLRKVAHAISGSLRRAGDFAARYDTDRFAVIISGADDKQAAKFAADIADKVRSLSIHHPRSPVARFVTVSFGTATIVPAWTSPASDLLAGAEQALEAEEGEQACDQAG